MNNTTQMYTTDLQSNQQTASCTYNTLTFTEAWCIFFQGKISKDKLYGEVRSGRIPHLRVGTKILFRKSTLEAWFQQQEENSVR